MITTASPALVATSQRLNESTTDTSTKRLGYFNQSVTHILTFKKWGFEKIKKTLTEAEGTQTYDLTSEFSDYDPDKGIVSVWVNGEKIDSIDYDRKADISTPTSQRFYLTPDNKTLGFIKDIEGGETIEIWLYVTHTNVSSDSEALTFNIPTSMLAALALYMKHLVHEGKRQRYDSRNALLDFKEEIDKLRPMAATKKIKDRPRTAGNIMGYNRVRRRYATH